MMEHSKVAGKIIWWHLAFTNPYGLFHNKRVKQAMDARFCDSKLMRCSVGNADVKRTTPADSFTILEPRNQEIDEFHVLQ